MNEESTPLADELSKAQGKRDALARATWPLPPSPRTVTIANQKGGVGKTTTAVNIASALARAGARVLVIDLDPQGNASTALGVEHQSGVAGSYEVVLGLASIRDVMVRSTDVDSLWCVPATINLAGAEIELVGLDQREHQLAQALARFHEHSREEPFHYIFIDCPPSLGVLTVNALVAATEVLIPIQCEYYALEGLSQLVGTIERIQRHLNPRLGLSTIVLTMFDQRTNLAQQVADDVRTHFPQHVLQAVIPRSVRVSEAPSYGQSVIAYDPQSMGALAYAEAALEFATRGAGS